jgi:predicted dehydrogenase
MDISRRKFIHKTGVLAAGSCLVPSLALQSCDSAAKAGHVRMGYIGPEETYGFYKPVFQKLKNTTVEKTSLDAALDSDLHAIFTASNTGIKATHIILLLEKNKDIITSYPLAGSLSEYNRIQEFLDRHNRRLGMLNPLYFYPSVITLKEFLGGHNHELTKIRIYCHPDQLVKGYPINGATGTVAPLQRMISFVTGKFPYSLFIEEKTNEIRRWILDYESFQATIQVDPGQTGWIMEMDGPELKALADHTGLLSINDEVIPRHSPAPHVWTTSMIKNFKDFLQAVRKRTEPMVNSLDGLSAIILHEAAVKTLHSGSKVNL